MDSKTRKILIALLVMIAMIIVAGLVGILLYANSTGALLTGSIGRIGAIQKDQIGQAVSTGGSNGGQGREKTPEEKAADAAAQPAPAEAVSSTALVTPAVSAPTSSPEPSTISSPPPAPKKVRRVAK